MNSSLPETEIATDQETPAEPAASAPPAAKSDGLSPLSLVGYLLGGLSFFNIVHDLSPLKLYGSLKSWIEAYTAFIASVNKFLFGWIDLYWFKLSDLEANVLVLAMVLSAAVVRASAAARKAAGMPPKVGNSMTGALVVIIAPILLLQLVLPGWLGLVGGVFWFGVIALWSLSANDKLNQFVPPSATVRNELIGVAAVFAVIVAANYLYFAGAE